MLHPWDTAAGSLIVTEAGGRVTKYNGDPFDPEFPEILASNGILHDRMIGIIHTA
jgi:myo-inositol-1(or 4)-monophosphatase